LSSSSYTIVGSYSLPVYGGSGTGLEVDIIVSPIIPYNITSIIPNSNHLGTGYLPSDTNLIIGTFSNNDWQTSVSYATFSITSILNGGVYATSSIESKGLGYKINDIVTINGGGSTKAQIKITEIEGELTRLPDTYKIIDSNNKIIEPVIGTFSNLLDGGLFLTNNSYNRYGYIHKTKFNKSRISSGIFKRAYIQNSLIKDESYDVSDKDFKNISNLKNLILVDTIFSNNNNILSKATYTNSFFVGGNDIWDNGILYDSIWNGMNFNNGLVKESIWINGTFSNGLFYNSKSFDNNRTYNYNQNIKSRYYKSGTESNSRFSWQDGTFLNGEFYKSDWENGTFKNGKFYNSKFYNGTFSNGLIGDKSIPVENTVFYNGVIDYAIVENSTIVSNKYNGISKSSIIWNNGIFNSGLFGTNEKSYIYSTDYTAIWNNGTFNGGNFIEGGKWKDGIFNGGKFISTFSWSNANSNKNNYSWENGIFNGGEFGNASTSANSTWFNGEFNGGQFKGRVWNNGIFLFGEFLGSGTNPLVVGKDTVSLDSSNPNLFVKSFTSDYYGLWRDGYVTDVKDKYITDKKLYTDDKRSNDTTRRINTASFKNVLWKNGIFSHPSGQIEDSVWLDGIFENGKFISSSFNPYVKRTTTATQSTFNFKDTCYWKNGTFDNGDFNISNWDNGTFITGTATGMVWNNGIVNYMNAYNIFWKDGLWRNGNWNGSYFDIDNGKITNDYVRQILNRGMSFSATSSCHVWNIFYNESISSSTNMDNSPAISVSFQPDQSIIDLPPTAPTLFGTENSGSLVVNESLVVTTLTINWDDSRLNSDPRTGTSETISIFQDISVANSNSNLSWEVSAGKNYSILHIWVADSTPVTTTNTFTTVFGVNQYRLKLTTINGGVTSTIYSNILEYTKPKPPAITFNGYSTSLSTTIAEVKTTTGTMTINSGSHVLKAVSTLSGGSYIKTEISIDTPTQNWARDVTSTTANGTTYESTTFTLHPSTYPTTYTYSIKITTTSSGYASGGLSYT